MRGRRRPAKLVSLFGLSLLACASSSARHPRSPAERIAAQREWSERARDQIRDYWNPWDVVPAVHPAGSPAAWPTTVLRIAVQPDGTASRPEIIRSAGIPALDELAVRAVTAALPLPEPPPEIGSPATFDLGFRVVGDESSPAAAADDARDPFPILTASCAYRATGAIDPLDVRSTVETYRRDVTTCVDEQRGAGPDVAGEVTVEFVITEAGSVQRPVIVKTGGLTRSLERCLLQTMSRWTFRKPAGGAVKVVFPFRFTEGQAAGADLRQGVTGPGRPLR